MAQRRLRQRQRKELEQKRSAKVLETKMETPDLQDDTGIPAVNALLKKCKLKIIKKWPDILSQEALRVVHHVSFVLSVHSNISLVSCAKHPISIQHHEELWPRQFTIQVLDKCRQEWLPLFVIKPSTIEGAGYGCFAARNYSAGQALGKYFGRVLDRVNVDTKAYTMWWPKMGKYIEQEGAGTGLQNRIPVYFGLHFCNDLGFKEKSRALTRSGTRNISSEANAWVHDDDLTVYASTFIHKSQEIFLDYQSN